MCLLTLKDINTIVSRAVGSKVTVVSHHLQDFSQQKNGIFGTHQLLVIKVEDTFHEKKTHTFFVKSRPESALIKDVMLDESTFLEEIHFYRQVQPLMMKYYQGERWAPRCFFANEDVLVSEDLREQGFSPRTDNFLDEQHLKSALSTLAKFHASSVLAETHLGKSLKDVFPSAFKEKVYTKSNKFGRSTPCGYETIALMAEKLDLNASLVPKILERVWNLVKPEEGKCNVICHGDLWKNNLLFDNSVSPKCVLVDCQLLRYASPLNDFFMLVYLHTTPEYRKKKNLELLQHYYSTFQDVLLYSECNPKIPSYESFLSDYYKRRLVGMSYACLYLPGIYLNSDEFTLLLNDPTALEKFLFHCRMDVVGASLDNNPTYKEQMAAIIGEIIEEAELLFT